jgi:hypothetical protein
MATGVTGPIGSSLSPGVGGRKGSEQPPQTSALHIANYETGPRHDYSGCACTATAELAARSAEGQSVALNARLGFELACADASEECTPLASAEAQHAAVTLFGVFYDYVAIGEFRDGYAFAVPAAHRTHSPLQASSHQSIADAAARSAHR